MKNFCKLERKETIKLLTNVVNESVQIDHILYERIRQKIPINFPIKNAGFFQRKVKNFLQNKKQSVINWDLEKCERIKSFIKSITKK